MRERFEDYIGPSPQTRINIDDLVRRGRRLRRRRQGVAAGLAFLGVAAVGMAIRPGKAAPPAPVTTISSAPATKVSEPDRLLGALKAAITREAPQVRGLGHLGRYVLQCAKGSFVSYDYVPMGAGVKPVPCPAPSGRTGTTVAELDRQYLWRGRVTSPTGTYFLQISISRGVYYDPSAPPVNAQDAAERKTGGTRRGPHGESILADNALLNMTKPDGTSILITARDTVEKGAYMTRSPFTAAQLTAIGLDPALALTRPR